MGVTKIEWTATIRPDGTMIPGYTANLWWGCTHVHEGCDFCYAEAWSNRFDKDKVTGVKTPLWGNDTPRREIRKTFADIKRYQRMAAEAGEIHRVFVGSMMDIFEKPMSLIDNKGDIVTSIGADGLEFELKTDWLRNAFFEMVPHCPNLMFLLLTKRPSNINKYIPEEWKDNPPANVMFGTSVVNQETADKLIPQLLQVNGKRFLSMEPQLDLVDLHRRALAPTWDFWLKHIDWIIQGGESGPHKRPFNTDWARITRDQCKTFGVPYFFKQVDKIQEIPTDLMIKEFPESKPCQTCGAKRTIGKYGLEPCCKDAGDDC